MEPNLPLYNLYVVELLPTGAGGNRYACSANEDGGGGGSEDDDFEFVPLLPHRRRLSARAGCPRTASCRGTAVVHAVVTQPPVPSQRAPRHRRAAAANKPAPSPAPGAPRKVRWHEMAFGSARVPAAMDMGEIRRRLQARSRRLAAGEGDEAAAAGWAPWRLIRSLSCKGVEAVAVAAAAAPVRLV
ncbi:hypothetical protein GUJ93_ZPchr0008g11873 [Zizania palustris]|uniref:Uncharacterized protein n=1 Tax=Zizania palustris TaxID=103762 RepID=A0A8J5VGL8_ZIZPA|nr:hypothetical protein GUJ93_ZPchr0008g11873 [Zizania palustris]